MSILDFQSRRPLLTEKIIFHLLFTRIVILCITSIVMILSLLLSKKLSLNREKISPFECGFDTNSNNRLPFSLRFFLITIIFLIFDVEIVLLIPRIISFDSAFLWTWSLVYFFFILILLLGLFHEWNQGALNWRL